MQHRRVDYLHDDDVAALDLVRIDRFDGHKAAAWNHGPHGASEHAAASRHSAPHLPHREREEHAPGSGRRSLDRTFDGLAPADAEDRLARFTLEGLVTAAGDLRRTLGIVAERDDRSC